MLPSAQASFALDTPDRPIAFGLLQRPDGVWLAHGDVALLPLLLLALMVFAFRRSLGGIPPSASASSASVRVERTEVAEEPVLPAHGVVQAPVVVPSSLPVVEPAASPRSSLQKTPSSSAVRSPRPVTKKSNCDPSFEIGADGIKRFKPECFK